MVLRCGRAGWRRCGQLTCAPGSEAVWLCGGCDFGRLGVVSVAVWGGVVSV